MQLQLHELLYLRFAEHKLPRLWLWDPTQRFQIINSCWSYSSKFRSIGSDGMRMISGSDFEREGTIPFRSQKSTSKVIQEHWKCSYGFPFIPSSDGLKPWTFLWAWAWFKFYRIDLSAIFDRSSLIFNWLSFTKVELFFLQLECSWILICTILSNV